MSKRWRIIALGAALLLLGAWLALSYKVEPRYETRTLSGWLGQYRSHSDDFKEQARIWQEADHAISRMGSNAVPFLVEKLKYRESSLLRRLRELLGHQSVISVRWLEDPGYAQMAMEGFRALGSQAKSAVPELRLLLAQPDKSDPAAQCLLSIGWETMPVFMEALSNRNSAVRLCAVRSLAEFGTNAAPALPVLLQWLDGSKADDRGYLAGIIGEIGYGNPNVIQVLTPLLQEQYGTAWGAALGLARSGQEGLWPLVLALTNQNPRVQIGAACALSKETRDRRLETTAPLSDASFQRIQSVFNLKVVGASLRSYPKKEYQAVIPAVAEMVGMSDRALRSAALEALKNYLSHPAEVRPVLLQFANDSDPGIRAEAERMLVRMNPNNGR
jgi:hypothetical protein